MSSPSKIVLCTGANQGLGYWIIQVAALRDPKATYLLCSRNVDSGKEALQKLKDAGVTAKVDLIQLDVTNDEQIDAAVTYVSKTYGRLDVLVNNAGILRQVPASGISAIRDAYNDILNVNLTSVAVLTTAFIPLLHQSADPKVINISSGLGSMQNSLTKKMGRSTPYGASKVGLNGLTVHMQVAENDQIEAEAADPQRSPRIRFYACAPGLLKTAFTKFMPQAKEPETGARVAVELIADEDEIYEGGAYWEFEEGVMRQVPW